MTLITEHLSLEELACHDRYRTPYPKEWRDDRMLRLAAVFETIRMVLGKPIKINSAYRTPRHNARVGGGKNSQHMLGRAIDLARPHGVDMKSFRGAIDDNADRVLIGGIGVYRNFVHVDIRPRLLGAPIARWVG